MSEFINPRAKLFQHLDRLDALQRGEIAPPVNVEIDLSNRCTLGCSFCHFAYTHTRGPNAGTQAKPDNAINGGDMMDTRLAFRILSWLEDYDVRSITWTGGGEPTLHPDFDKIINTCLIDQGLYTNGTNITPERAKLLKERCEWVYISLDAADKESYQMLKRVDRFETVCKAVSLLVSAEGDATIGVGFLLTATNWRDYPRMAELGRTLGADYVQFRPAVLFDDKRPGKLTEDTGWITKCAMELRPWSRMQGIEIDLDRFERYREWAEHGYPICYWSGMQAVITPNGKVWTCCNRREYPGDELGDLKKASFAEIWKYRRLKKVDDKCRVMCRGHMPNLTLSKIIRAEAHSNFI